MAGMVHNRHTNGECRAKLCKRWCVKDSYPVFVVGVPRSGTKLLRTLLNNHPEVSLGHEGNFIPALVARFGLDTDVSERGLWSEVYRTFANGAYYHTMAKEGLALSEESFVDALSARAAQKTVTWADLFEVILRAYGPRPEAPIYGDKSHGYINDIHLLRTLFPNVRFLYIVRDPRDQALSSLKIWGRSPLRSAHHWYRVAAQAERLGFATATDVLTVRYEDLTDDTDTELKRVCAFLGLPYPPEMTKLTRPAEKGRLVRQLNTVTKQQAKYRDALPARVVRNISEITLPYLSTYGYSPENARRHRKLSRAQLKLLSYFDGLATMRFHARDKGLIKGVNYYLKRHAEASAVRSNRS